MHQFRRAVSGVVLAMLCIALHAPQAAAQNVTTDDLQLLQDDIDRVSRENPAASDLQRELDRVRDDAAYLRVKLRRNETVERREYLDIRDRLDEIRSRARRAT